MIFRCAFSVVTVLFLVHCAPSDPNDCGIRGAGIITGDPSLELGRGSKNFVSVNDGDDWGAANGPQGGSHLWVSVRSGGVGPSAVVDMRFEELDGGIIASARDVKPLCASAPPTRQERIGLRALLPSEPSRRHRVLCDGPFVLHVQLTDSTGKKAEARKRVGQVVSDEDSFIPFQFRCDAGMPDADGGT